MDIFLNPENLANLVNPAPKHRLRIDIQQFLNTTPAAAAPGRRGFQPRNLFAFILGFSTACSLFLGPRRAWRGTGPRPTNIVVDGSPVGALCKRALCLALRAE